MNAKQLWAAMRGQYAGSPAGLNVNGPWLWTFKHEGTNVPVGRAVKTLEKHGIVECSYYSGGRASANLTDKGRNPQNCPLHSGWPK